MSGYAFNFDGHGVFTPDGRADTITDVDAHNKALEQAEIERFRTNPPDRAFLYVKHEPNLPCVRFSGAPPYYANEVCQITTWVGTVLDGRAVMGPSREFPCFGPFPSRRRSVDCRIFGTRYVGWYMESSGDYCRLRKAKRQ